MTTILTSLEINTFFFILGSFIGFVIGFVVGFCYKSLLDDKFIKPANFLAWMISIIWLAWLSFLALDMISMEPPTVFNLVSGSAVGYILGDKFLNFFKELKR